MYKVSYKLQAILKNSITCLPINQYIHMFWDNHILISSLYWYLIVLLYCFCEEVKLVLQNRAIVLYFQRT